jgi:hypothetical protein
MINATSRRTRALWNWLNEAGARWGYPGHSDHLSHRAGGRLYDQRLPGPRAGQRMGLPSPLKQELLGELGEFLLAPDERYRSTPWLDRFLET